MKLSLGLLLGSLARICLDLNWDADDGTGAGEGVVCTGAGDGVVGTGAGVAKISDLVAVGVCWLTSKLLGGREHV